MSIRPHGVWQLLAATLAVAACFVPAQVALADDALSTGRTIGVGRTSSEAAPVLTVASYDGTQSGSSVESLKGTHSHTSYSVHKLGPTETSQQAGVSLENGAVVVREDQGWRPGLASAYTLACNDGYDATASGAKLEEDSMTVAVPANRSDLLGKTVEIYYNGTTVTATVTDTGGFAAMGRDLDLAGGVWRALGASSTDDWGVRTVSYRFL